MPREVCSKCREVKDVRLCADDLLCKDCDADNERRLAAIRASNTGSKSSSAVGSRQMTECPPKSRGTPVQQQHCRQSLSHGLQRRSLLIPQLHRPRTPRRHTMLIPFLPLTRQRRVRIIAVRVQLPLRVVLR
jgi:hypothetical protein